MEKPSYDVFIVEDDMPTCERLVTIIKRGRGLRVAGTAHSLAAAMAQQTCAAKCDAVLVDLGLPDGDGIDFINALSAADSPPSILVISVFGDERRVIRAIEAGARGYLLKDADEESLVESLHSTIAGDCPINPAIARHLLRRFTVVNGPSGEISAQRPTPVTRSPLTPKETQVLELLARGFGNSESADLLSISVNTITTHTKNIYRKLAVRSRSEAVFEASQLGLIEVRIP